MISPDDLSPEQQAQIHAWTADGVSLGEIQSRIDSEFGIKATYMEMHLLMIDLQVELPEEEEEEEAAAEEAQPETLPDAEAAPAEQAAPAEEAGSATEAQAPEPEPPGADPNLPPGIPDDLPKVAVTISDLTRPGMMACGEVTFEDTGDAAEWYMDQFGRLGLNPTNPDFKPSEMQVMAFQVELQRIARSRGMM